MNKTKRIMCGILCGMLLLAGSACGKGGDAAAPTPSGTQKTGTGTAGIAPTPGPTEAPTAKKSLVNVKLGTLVNDGDGEILFEGSWTHGAGENLDNFDTTAYGGDHTYSLTVGDTASYTFQGTRLMIFATLRDGYGTAEVTLDDGEPQSIQFHSIDGTKVTEDVRQHMVYDSGVLEAGEHTFVMTVTSPDVNIDFILMEEPPEENLTLQGDWQFVVNEDAYYEDLAAVMDSNAVLRYEFEGTQIKIYGATAPEFGRISVFLDGGEAVIQDLASSEAAAQVLLFDSGILSETENASHTVEIKVMDEKPVNIDFFEVYRMG